MSEVARNDPSTRKAQEAEKALRERDRLYRHYRRAKRSYRQNLYAEHPMGWHLREFARQLARYKLADATAFLTYVQEENRSWLLTAPPDIRAEALSLINERVQQIRIKAGMLPLNDPLPGEEDDVWQLAKQEMT